MLYTYSATADYIAIMIIIYSQIFAKAENEKKNANKQDQRFMDDLFLKLF